MPKDGKPKETAAAKAARKAAEAEKAAQKAAKEAQLAALRSRVRKLMVPHLPASPLENAAAAALALRTNPWLLQHDPVFCDRFLGDLLAILKECGPERLRKLGESVTVEEALEHLEERRRGEGMGNREMVLPSQAEDPFEEKEEERMARVARNVAVVLAEVEELSDFAACQPVGLGNEERGRG